MQPYMDGGDARVSTPKEEEEKEGKKGGLWPEPVKDVVVVLIVGSLIQWPGVYIYTRGLTRLQVRST
jgi:hypothetical protein